jgi:hypothetical protein
MLENALGDLKKQAPKLGAGLAPLVGRARLR